MERQTRDIDRKLAIYYHPLFQELMQLLLGLFDGSPTELGMLDFLEFNLKLQKALLPRFEVENALTSALNDWVKEVGESMLFEGMVSTANCSPDEPPVDLLSREHDAMHTAAFASKQEFVSALQRQSSHPAFRLLGLRIHREVFSKFMFDLCSTWCEFLDVELFANFLVGIYLQVSHGLSLDASIFRPTLGIATLALEFMHHFEELKLAYHTRKRKQLKYYRAWCEWNYLRLPQLAPDLLSHLGNLYPDDPRVLELPRIFQTAIGTIAHEITQDAPTQPPPPPATEDQLHPGLQVKPLFPAKHEALPNQSVAPAGVSSQPAAIGQLPLVSPGECEHHFYIHIDAEGNLFLRNAVKLGVKGRPMALLAPEEAHLARMHMRTRAFRESSNLYSRLTAFKVRLEHSAERNPYQSKPRPDLLQRDAFYSDRDRQQPHNDDVTGEQPLHHRAARLPRLGQATTVEPHHYPKAPISKPKSHSAAEQPPPGFTSIASSYSGEPLQSGNVRPYLSSVAHGRLLKNKLLGPNASKVVSLHSSQERVDQLEVKSGEAVKDAKFQTVLIPSFLSGDSDNAFTKKDADIFGGTASAERRDLKLGLSKPQYRPAGRDLLRLASYHLVGRLTPHPSLSGYQLLERAKKKPSKYEEDQRLYEGVLKQYLSAAEMEALADFRDFYRCLMKVKQQFGRDHRSAFRVCLHEKEDLANLRADMGAALTAEEQATFFKELRRRLENEQKRRNRRRKKLNMRVYRRAFRSATQRSTFESVFLEPHRAEIRKSRAQSTMQDSKAMV